MAIVIVQAKSMQKWYFLVSKLILKRFFWAVAIPLTFLRKNWVKMVPKQVFTGGGAFKARPYKNLFRDHFDPIFLHGKGWGIKIT